MGTSPRALHFGDEALRRLIVLTPARLDIAGHPCWRCSLEFASNYLTNEKRSWDTEFAALNSTVRVLSSPP